MQISNQGILKVSGQRTLSDTLKHIKFYKEISAPTNKYDTQSIHAKFVNSNLIITLPKLKTPIPELIDDKMPSSEPSKIDQTPPTKSTTGAPSGIGGGAKQQIQTPSPSANALTECQFECRKWPIMDSKLTNVAASLAATAAAVAVLVAYVLYMYKSTTEIDD